MKRLALAMSLFATPALAQGTVEQRIGAQIGALVIQNAALSEQIESLKAQIAAAKACEKPPTADQPPAAPKP